jgi:hypothetical protein
MSKTNLRHDVDLAVLPPLNEKQEGELTALAARRIDAIDYSDISPLTEYFWKNAARGLRRRVLLSLGDE